MKPYKQFNNYELISKINEERLKLLKGRFFIVYALFM